MRVYIGLASTPPVTVVPPPKGINTTLCLCARLTTRTQSSCELGKKIQSGARSTNPFRTRHKSL